MIGEGIVSKQTGVPGWHTDQEAEKLIELAARYVPDSGIVVELGGEYGKSASEFGYALKGKQNIRIFTVDLFPDDHPIAKNHGGLLAVWRTNLAETGLSDHHLLFLPMRGKSYDIGAKWTEGAIDLLFIDAAHDYLSVKSDIASWVQFVKPGGVVIFHDYWKNPNSHPVHLEVKKAVDEWQYEADQKWERHDAPDSLVYFVKPLDSRPENVTIKDGTLPTGSSYSKTTGVPGWLSEQEEKKLIDLARLFVPETGVIVELGGGLGRSAAAFGYACKNKKHTVICTVDLFDSGSFSQRLPFNQWEAWRDNITKAMEKAKTPFYIDAKNQDGGGIFFQSIQVNSQHDPFWQGSGIDLLFIDADHDYESVLADIKAWSPYVKRGGLMVFHDYHRGDYKDVFHGVVKAVNEWREIYKDDWLEIEAPGSLAVYKRQVAHEQIETVEYDRYDKQTDTTPVEISAGTNKSKPKATKATRKPRTKKTR